MENISQYVVIVFQEVNSLLLALIHLLIQKHNLQSPVELTIEYDSCVIIYSIMILLKFVCLCQILVYEIVKKKLNLRI